MKCCAAVPSAEPEQIKKMLQACSWDVQAAIFELKVEELGKVPPKDWKFQFLNTPHTCKILLKSQKGDLEKAINLVTKRVTPEQPREREVEGRLQERQALNRSFTKDSGAHLERPEVLKERGGRTVTEGETENLPEQKKLKVAATPRATETDPGPTMGRDALKEKLGGSLLQQSKRVPTPRADNSSKGQGGTGS